MQRKIQTLTWVAWNKGVVDTEELVVAFALIGLVNGATNISLTGVDRVAIRQTLIDEYFHSHRHEVAIGISCRGRKLE